MQPSSQHRLICIHTGLFYLIVALLPILSLWVSHSAAALFTLAAFIPLWFFLRDHPWKRLTHSALANITLIWFGWASVSLLWTIVPLNGVVLWLQLAFMFLGTYALIWLTPSLTDAVRMRTLWTLVIALTIALLTANIEIFSHGVITQYFHSFLSKPYVFTLVDFNRASTIMALLIWPALYFLWKQNQKSCAYALYALALVTILRLESQSASMSILLASLVLPMILITGKKGITVLMVCVPIICSIIPVVASHMDPEAVFQSLPSLPEAAMQYRLHIWHFASTKAQLHPWLGWGFNASRSIPIQPEDYLFGNRSPLPIHPHDNILQIWLELGIVGLILFSAFLISLLGTIRKLETRTMMGFSCALMISFFAIGSTGYGIWQHWLIGSGILACVLLTIGIHRTEPSH